MLRKILVFWKQQEEDWEDAGRRCKHRLQRALSQYAVSDWLQVIDRMQWRLLHKIYGDDDSWPKVVMTWTPSTGKRSRGRPKTRWTDNVNRYLNNKHGTCLRQIFQDNLPFDFAKFEKDFVDFIALQ